MDLQPIIELEKKDKIDYRNSLRDIIKILSLEFSMDTSDEQLIIEELYYDILKKIGLLKDVKNTKEIGLLREFIIKELKIDYYYFINLIKQFSDEYGTEDKFYSEENPIKNYCEYFRLRKIKEQAASTNPLLIDLFSGAGGMSLGFKHSGFNIALANDIEKACVDTYRHNHPEVPPENVVLDDIQNVMSYCKELLPNKKIDLIIGGPPCQGFSNANRQRLIDDPRNSLYKYFVQFVDFIKPSFFVMENVVGMKTISDQVIEDFEALGYDVHCEVLNSSEFGVPQNRKRLIFIGNLVGVPSKEIFNEIHDNSNDRNQYLLQDALYGLKELKASTIKNSTELDTDETGHKIDKNIITQSNDYMNLINEKSSKFVYNHKARYNNNRDIEIFGRLHQGDRSDDEKIADIMPYKNRNHIFKDKYFKLQNDKFSKTITAHMKFDCNMYIHPTQARGLTPREAARVQSFPDDYFFQGAYTKTYMQIGNSVPPLMGREIGKVLKKYIEKSKEI